MKENLKLQGTAGFKRRGRGAGEKKNEGWEERDEKER